MEEFSVFFQLLESGSDAVLILFGWILFKIERRVLSIENNFTNHLKGD